ncbi:stalk domain-containing protein [Moorellaceae bacterium AZ2]
MGKSKAYIAVVLGLLFSLSAVLPAWATPFPTETTYQTQEQEQEQDQEQVQVQEQEQEQEQEGREGGKVRHAKEHPKSVTGHVYRGIENALQHVKNPVARAALQAKLEGKSVAEAVYEAKALLAQWQDPEELANITQGLEESLDEDDSLDDLDRAEAKKQLVELYFKAGRANKAREVLETILAQIPDDDEAYEELDEACAMMGDLKVKVFFRGKQMVFDVEPRVEKNRVLVPLRQLAESLGARVSYDNGVVTIENHGLTIRLMVGSREANVNGALILLDVPAEVREGRMLVPLRFVSENLMAKVQYYGKSNLVAVN